MKQYMKEWVYISPASKLEQRRGKIGFRKDFRLQISKNDQTGFCLVTLLYFILNASIFAHVPENMAVPADLKLYIIGYGGVGGYSESPIDCIWLSEEEENQ